MNRERWQQLLAAALALAVWQGAAMLGLYGGYVIFLFR